MASAHGRSQLETARAVADRLDALADTADLMDDEAGAKSLRDRAATVRLQAMQSLDGRPEGGPTTQLSS